MPDPLRLLGLPETAELRVGTVQLERRAADAPATVAGYAAVFGQEVQIGRWFRERIDPGAFASALARPDDVRALFNHDPNFVLGRTTAGTLRLAVDARGLRYEADPPDASWARDLVASIQRGDVSQSSFAFRVTKEEWQESDDPKMLPLRLIKDVELFDVSPVTYPAYDQTSVGARDAAAALQQAAAVRDLASASSPQTAPLSLARWRVRIAQGDEV